MLLDRRAADLLRAVGEGDVLRFRTPGDDMRLQVDDPAELRDGLRGLVASRVSQPADVEDIVQDVVERTLRRRTQLRDPERAEAWLMQIVRNAIIDHHRRRRHSNPADPTTLEGVRAVEEDRQPTSSVLAPCVAPLVDSLPHSYAEALRLTDLGPHTQEDAASHLGLSASGMKSRVQRGRRLLEAELRGCCEVERDARGTITDVAPRPRSRCGAAAPCLEDATR